ncbi:coiled-coil-helix-coiled-coil-helix domain-containing protein 7 [Anarhichas minor]|uniref:coiled-coil-helix-coiled-coil-helix domain-containing protein 7 n=1 Tax=Anarhichas minor TaxID=65739 RepID=UPI003F73F9B9
MLSSVTGDGVADFPGALLQQREWSCLEHDGEVRMDKTVRKVRNQDSNPCIEESDASQKCLGAYNYDSRMCSAYFQRYKSCRKYWHSIMQQRRRDGVRPDMPTAAERQEMLAAIGGKPY